MTQDILISGLINGSVYALLAIGFSLVFGVARIVNIAHTAFYMFAAYAIHTLFNNMGLSPLIAVPLAVVGVTALGMLAYKLIIERIREHETTVLIATIALALVMQETMFIIYGGHFRGNPNLVEGKMDILGVGITYQQLLTLGLVLVVLGGTWWMLMKSRLGNAIRATADDREIANLMGMNVNRIASLTIGISVFLAAIGGAVVAPLRTVTPLMWLEPLVPVLAIVVLGGLGSLKGSFIAAYLIGFVETITVFAFPEAAYLKGAMGLSIMVIVLLIRPEGLFGVVFEEER